MRQGVLETKYTRRKKVNVNVNQVLVSLRGEPLKDGGEGAQKAEITLKTVLVNALHAPIQNKKLPGAELQKRYHLAKRIWGVADEINLKSDEIVLLKEVVAEVYQSPAVVGQVWDMLEPEPTEASK